MIQYDYVGMHELYRMEIPTVLDALMVKYPDAKLDRVELFWRPLDQSIATTEPPVLKLNAYWFSQKPQVLIDASKLARGWHCSLGQEPRRVLTHEFGHALMAARPHLRDYAEEAWENATLHPALAISGYALVDADEFWAEEFAAYELGVLAGRRRERMREVLAG